MKRATIYSRSPSTAAPKASAEGASEPVPKSTLESPHSTPFAHGGAPSFAPASLASESAARPAVSRARPAAAVWSRSQRMLGLGALLLAVVTGLALGSQWRPRAAALTQADIDAAVLHALETQNPPSRAARAAAAVMPSIVLVRSGEPEVRRSADRALDAARRGRAVGTGVVIADDGTVLTSWHVVAGASRITLTFHDRSETEATIVSVRPDKDLVVLKPRRVPDDLQPATLRSTAGVVPGDEVVAVGFPFGIGPSVSSGVVSGLGREHRIGERDGVLLTNLIQFDAAANPGNSGGPLITLDGRVVGIVCSILNPTDQAFFVGIGMAVPIEDAAAAAGMPPA